jgi:hypothetical protein
MFKIYIAIGAIPPSAKYKILIKILALASVSKKNETKYRNSGLTKQKSMNRYSIWGTFCPK